MSKKSCLSITKKTGKKWPWFQVQSRSVPKYVPGPSLTHLPIIVSWKSVNNFWIILFTDKLTDKQINQATNVKTIPPLSKVIHYKYSLWYVFAYNNYNLANRRLLTSVAKYSEITSALWCVPLGPYFSWYRWTCSSVKPVFSSVLK